MSEGTSLAGRRVLVTGACGFIGTNLVHALVVGGADVVALDLPEADWARLPEEADRVAGDLLERASLVPAVAGCDLVIHLAARTDIDGRSVDEYTANTVGTRNLVEEVVAAGCASRFVHYSTQLVVGLFGESRFIDETEPYRTRTAYGESKIESERIVRELCSDAGLGYTIIRPTSVYGPWGAEPYREFFRAIKNRRYVHVGKADNLVSLVYVGNLVDLTVLLASHPIAAGETFFANDFHPYTMREVVDLAAAHYGVRIRRVPAWLLVVAAYGLGIFKLLGFRVPLYPFRLRNMRMTYCYDIQKSVRLGYEPRDDLASGIEQALAWYDAHPSF